MGNFRFWPCAVLRLAWSPVIDSRTGATPCQSGPRPIATNKDAVELSESRLGCQVSHGYANASGDLHNRHHARILHPPFDAAHVRAINMAAMRKFFLRDAARLAQCPDCGAERQQRRVERVF